MSELERRATDVDRQRAVDRLRRAAADGNLSLHELEGRLDAVLSVGTVGELATIVWDLETVDPSPPPRRSSSLWHNKGFRYHASAYGLTNAFLVGTWALTGHGFFWPFFPIAGWGIGLGIHAVAVHGESVQPPPTVVVAPTRRAAVTEGAGKGFVAVLFTDVVNSTGLTEAMGDADWARVRAGHHRLVRECVAAHDGQEVSSLGDGVLARFGSAQAAVRCAMSIQLRLQEQRETSWFAPSVRIGIHAGEAIDEGVDVIGATVNIAARVVGEAGGDEILITEAVAERLSDAVVLHDRGLRTLRGVEHPRHLLSVSWRD